MAVITVLFGILTIKARSFIRINESLAPLDAAPETAFSSFPNFRSQFNISAFILVFVWPVLPIDFRPELICKADISFLLSASIPCSESNSLADYPASVRGNPIHHLLTIHISGFNIHRPLSG